MQLIKIFTSTCGKFLLSYRKLPGNEVIKRTEKGYLIRTDTARWPKRLTVQKLNSLAEFNFHD